MNMSDLTSIIFLLIGSIFLIWKSSITMIEKKKIFIFLPWFFAGFFYCFLAGFLVEGLNHFASDFGIVVKLFTYSLLLYILWGRKWE